MKTPDTTLVETRLEKRMSARLAKHGFKLVKRRGGYAVLVYNEVIDAFIEADGMTPIPYCLTLHDVIDLTHQYVCEAEQAELAE